MVAPCRARAATMAPPRSPFARCADSRGRFSRRAASSTCSWCSGRAHRAAMLLAQLRARSPWPPPRSPVLFAVPLMAVTTCRPLPPVVLTKGASPQARAACAFPSPPRSRARKALRAPDRDRKSGARAFPDRPACSPRDGFPAPPPARARPAPLVVDHDDRACFSPFDPHRRRCGHRRQDVALEETLAIDAVGRAHDGNGPVLRYAAASGARRLR